MKGCDQELKNNKEDNSEIQGKKILPYPFKVASSEFTSPLREITISSIENFVAIYRLLIRMCRSLHTKQEFVPLLGL